ncbi:MAG: metal-dependent hydrolase [Acidobacteria bacterium]|nr:metal-dependent hydrolase [Acidobacteriota bacterium]
MEPITHFLTGACLSRAGFNRKTALATATMTLAAEAPDLDVFWGFKGPVFGFAHHRGFTHSFLGLVLISFVATGFMYLVWRVRGRRTNVPNLPLRWPLLLVYAYIAGLSHILLDFTNNYGVRPLWPFSEKWYSWDIVFIFEPALYIILILGLLLPAVFSRDKPLPRGRRAAQFALLCVVVLYAARDHEHRRALEALAKKDFRFGSSRAAPLRASVYPYYWSMFRWYAVAEMKDFFASSDIDARSGELDSGELELIAKPPETPATAAAKRSYLGRVYLDWARYPLVGEVSAGEDSIVLFKDLRFEYPPLRSRITLSCSIELDRNLRVVRETFGRREQLPPTD